MLISHQKQFIFTKTPKTASTSVEAWFERYCLPEGPVKPVHHRGEIVGEEGVIGARGPEASGAYWFNHMTASAIRDRVGAQTWSRYFKFCVVRNPFDLLVSWFWFQVSKGKFEITAGESPVSVFERSVAPGVPVLGRVQYMIDNRFCLDAYVRFDALHEDLTGICAKLGIVFESASLPRYKSGLRDKSIAVAEFFSPALRLQVEKAYAPEIERFGFRFPQ